MKKVLIASLFPALIAGSFPAFSAPEKVSVDGGKINFAGSIVAAPCAVDNDSDGQIVKLGQVPTNRLANSGSTSSNVPFTIKLSGCDLTAKDAVNAKESASYTNASVTFSGVTIAGKTDVLGLAANGAADITAQNVGIQILQGGTAVNVDGSTATTLKKLHTGTNELKFSANYVSTGDATKPVVAGLANSTVGFTVNYE